MLSVQAQAAGRQLPYKILKEGDKFGLVNERGKQILPPRYDSLQYTQHQEQFIAYLEKGKENARVGLINSKGKELITITYRSVRPVALTLYAVADYTKKEALFNADGEALSPFKFDEITSFKGALARFYTEGKAGLLDSNGKVKLPAQYKDILIRSDSIVDVVELREWKVLDAENKLLVSLNYDSIKPLGEDRWAAITRFYDAANRPTDMTALTDAGGKILKPYSPIEIRPFKQGVAIIKEKNRYGLLNRNGQSVLPAEWDSLSITQSIAVAGMRLGKNWRYHIFSLEGKKLSRKTFEHIVSVPSGPLPAKLNGQWGYVDSLGNETLVCRYDSTHAFMGNYAKVQLDGKEGLINKDGLWQIRPYAENILQITADRFLLRKELGYHLTDDTGLILYDTPNTLVWLDGNIGEVDAGQQWTLLSVDGQKLTKTGNYQWIGQQLKNGAHLAKRLGQIGILSHNGQQFIAAGPDTFGKIYQLSEEFFSISKNNQQGFVDMNGKLRIANRYDSVTYFSDGMAAVQIRGRWGYVDKIERLRIQPILEEARPFHNGLAIAKYNGSFGLTDAYGKWVLPAEYDNIERLNNGTYVLYSGSLRGLASQEGHRVVSPKFDEVTDLGNNYLMVSRDGKKGLIKTNGVSTIPMVYDILVYDSTNQQFLASQKAGQIKRTKISLTP